MIINIYFIFVMSSKSKRVFLGVKHTVSDQRVDFKVMTMKLLKCLKS